jgi:hypothetical protein
VNYWKVILATLVIFGAGVITGGLLVNYTSRTQTPAPIVANNRPPGNPPVLTPWQMRNRDLVRRMEAQLDLTTEQRTNIEHIIVDSQERTKGLWRPIVPQMAREMQHVNALIRAELNPEQQRHFDELLKPRQPKKMDDSLLQQERRHHANSNPPSADIPANP